jgi:hypothetical protein
LDKPTGTNRPAEAAHLSATSPPPPRPAVGEESQDAVACLGFAPGERFPDGLIWRWPKKNVTYSLQRCVNPTGTGPRLDWHHIHISSRPTRHEATTVPGVAAVRSVSCCQRGPPRRCSNTRATAPCDDHSDQGRRQPDEPPRKFRHRKDFRWSGSAPAISSDVHSGHPYIRALHAGGWSPASSRAGSQAAGPSAVGGGAGGGARLGSGLGNDALAGHHRAAAAIGSQARCGSGC